MKRRVAAWLVTCVSGRSALRGLASRRIRKREGCWTRASRRWAGSRRCARSRTSRAKAAARRTRRGRACSPTARSSRAPSRSRTFQDFAGNRSASAARRRAARAILPTQDADGGHRHRLLLQHDGEGHDADGAGRARRRAHQHAPRSGGAAAAGERARGDARQPGRGHDRRAPPQPRHLLDRRRRPGRPRVRRRHGAALPRPDARRQRRARRRAQRDRAVRLPRGPARRARVQLPYRATTIVGGRDDAGPGVQRRSPSTPAPRAGLMDPPSDAESVPAAPPGAGVTLTKLGEDVYFAGGGSHHSLFVVFQDHVVVVEAPLNEERSLAVLAKIAETAPGKPVRYVVPTHYHFDHSGRAAHLHREGHHDRDDARQPRASSSGWRRPRTRSGPTACRASRARP